ncbi:uncharacterized protein LOC116344779 isoform X2 [Contarinia nasturtii]|uniref:uncharacterized protein LOC116344779 isoform X2 n=1 Tax=Contarinia nasturtii TaxID=265458 RepID=UPI0012D41D6A|nr:uncharacterized protein LOC116344779 isoform X2 [Contarinia nasturtii]
MVSRVSSTDGSPHKTLVLIVCLSGLLCATIIVSLVVFLLRKSTRNEFIMMQHIISNAEPKSQREQMDVESQEPQPSTSWAAEAITCEEPQPSTSRPKTKIFAIFGSSKQSFDLN